MNEIFIGVGFVVVMAMIYTTIYNKFIALKQKVNESWSGVSVQLKRRYDLIPNLVNIVKGYAKHEQETLLKVVELRNSAMKNNGSPANQAKDENALSGALKSIFALSENYPDLKANQNFLKLQEELSETEDQIAAARRIYNGNISLFNTKTQSIPSNIVASIHGFKTQSFFEMEKMEKTPVKIKL